MKPIGLRIMESLVQGQLARRVRWGGCRNVRSVRGETRCVLTQSVYEMRQAFIHHGIYLSYEEMDKRMQSYEAYKALPAKVSQQVLKQLAEAWKAFREAQASYEEDLSKFTGRPRLPKYKHKTEGRNLLIYTIQALSRG